MRVALCLFGMVGGKISKAGKSEDLDPNICCELYQKNIIQANLDVDTFIHSWSINHKERLISIYDPVDEIIEEQRQFPQSENHPRLHGRGKQLIKETLIKYFDKKQYQALLDERRRYAFRTYSRWYSSKKAIELKSNYEAQKGFKYDCVIVSRLDVGFFKELNFKNYNLEKFWASHRNHAPDITKGIAGDRRNHDAGNTFADLWFFSNSENMDKFSTLYDHIEDYEISPHRSSLQHVKRKLFPSEIGYTLYRWDDYELVRRKLFGSSI